MNRSELLAACLGRSDFPPGHLVLETLAGGSVLSHVDVYWRTVAVGDMHAIQLAGIANVCTDPHYRGLGLARGLLRAAHVQAREHADYAALFSDYTGFYGPLGYRETGVPSFLVCELDGTPWPPGPIDTRGQW